MKNNHPSLAQMTRAPFLSSIISPLIAGTLLAVLVSGRFELLNFVVVLIMGICLHIATNVYNDIYDTKQGTDKINVHRNEFSGGSGVLLNFPDLLPKMYSLARIGLIAKREGCWQFSSRFSKSLANLSQKTISFMTPTNEEKDWLLLYYAKAYLKSGHRSKNPKNR